MDSSARLNMMTGGRVVLVTGKAALGGSVKVPVVRFSDHYNYRPSAARCSGQGVFRSTGVSNEFSTLPGPLALRQASSEYAGRP